MVSLNDFIDPDLTANSVAHTSGYVSNSGAGAGGGGLSMEQRRKQMYGRQIVGSYSQSQLGSRYASAKARTADQKRGRVYDASSDTFEDNAKFSNRRQGSGSVKDRSQVDSSSINRRQHYIELPRRGYNPFG